MRNTSITWSYPVSVHVLTIYFSGINSVSLFAFPQQLNAILCSPSIWYNYKSVTSLHLTFLNLQCPTSIILYSLPCMLNFFPSFHFPKMPTSWELVSFSRGQIQKVLLLFSTYALQPSRLIVQSGLDVPNFATRRLHTCHHVRAPSGGRRNCGREMSGNFA